MTIAKTNRKPGGVPIPNGLVLRQTITSGTSVTIPNDVNVVFAIVIGAGGGAKGGNSDSGGGAGGIVWGWTYAANTCIIGASSRTASGGYSRYGHLIAGGGTYGETTSSVTSPILGGASGGLDTTGTTASGAQNMFGGHLSPGVTNISSPTLRPDGNPGIGSSGGAYNSNATTGAVGGSGGNGISGGGGGTTASPASGTTKTAGNGGSGFIGGGGGSVKGGSSRTAIGGNGGSGYGGTGGTGLTLANSSIAANGSGGGGAGYLGPGSDATLGSGSKGTGGDGGAGGGGAGSCGADGNQPGMPGSGAILLYY